MTAKPGYRQVNIHLHRDDFAQLAKIAESNKLHPTTQARALLLDVLRDDAVAHGAGAADLSTSTKGETDASDH